MKLGQVIGRVTLSQQDPAYQGGRFLLVLPWTPPVGACLSASRMPSVPLSPGNSFVAYDSMGAGLGDVIGYSESGEAAAAFEDPVPIDALCCALIDQTFYQPVS